MRRTVVIGAIAPHGELAIPEACDAQTVGLAPRTQQAMAELGRRVAAARPDTVVIVTPHNLHVAGHLAVVTAGQLAGTLDDAPRPLSLRCRVDRELAIETVDRMAEAGLPAAAVTFGANSPAESVAPLDWGALIPLWPILRAAPDLPVVLVAPARELDADAHRRAGVALVRAARALGRQIAVIASADQGHGHRADGPYGYTPASAAFDTLVADLVKRGALEELLTLDPGEVEAAVADSWWQMLVLHGALQEDGGPFVSELLAYEVPTYYGMLTALLTA
ncbi:MAG: extradiol ring-cleavage dioxygenase [Candidatus Limnocylindrales bacterium]